jgi:hypothetical protein
MKAIGCSFCLEQNLQLINLLFLSLRPLSLYPPSLPALFSSSPLTWSNSIDGNAPRSQLCCQLDGQVVHCCFAKVISFQSNQMKLQGARLQGPNLYCRIRKSRNRLRVKTGNGTDVDDASRVTFYGSCGQIWCESLCQVEHSFYIECHNWKDKVVRRVQEGQKRKE